MDTDTCIFCRIIAGKTPGYFVYESARVVAFLDIDQAAPGHLLIVPRVHVAHWWELSAEDAAQIAVVARPLMVALMRAMGADGVRVLQTNGRAAGQEVFHVHVHLIPRWTEGRPAGTTRLSAQAMTERAAQLRAALAEVEKPE